MELREELDQRAGLEPLRHCGARSDCYSAARTQAVDHERAVVRHEVRPNRDRRHAIAAFKSPGGPDRRKHDAVVIDEIAGMPGMAAPRQVGGRGTKHAFEHVQGLLEHAVEGRRHHGEHDVKAFLDRIDRTVHQHRVERHARILDLKRRQQLREVDDHR